MGLSDLGKRDAADVRGAPIGKRTSFPSAIWVRDGAAQAHSRARNQCGDIATRTGGWPAKAEYGR
jgi:hypothetical protein